MRLQRYTTTAEVSDRWVKEVRPLQLGGMRGFRIMFA
jgi:hypothetical protein